MAFRILVWDNNSRDQTLTAVRQAFPDVQTHDADSDLRVAGGRNVSAEMAIHALGATHLLFLDDDIEVEAGSGAV